MEVAVVKVGGSLALQPEKLRALCRKLGEVSADHHFVVVPGGGEFADTVRRLDERFGLSSWASHRMAILGMDQYGLLLADLIPKAAAVNTFEDAKRAVAAGRVSVFLSSQVMFMDDPLANSWAVTSDSIALYIAEVLNAEKLLLVTDVDGIYSSDPKSDISAQFFESINPVQLLALKERTSVDANLPVMLQKSHVDCFVLNGCFPERLESILSNQPARCTQISSR